MVWRALLVCLTLVLGVGLIHTREVGAQNIPRLQSGVVKITAKPPSGTTSIGTGFIVRLETNAAYIVTAAHVVAGDPNPKVEFFTKQHVQLPAEVLPGAEVGDDVGGLALLLVKGKENLPSGIAALPLASTSLMLEDMVMIGFPLGAGPWHVTKGNIGSRQGRTIYFDPRVDSGNSGGPIIQKGKVVGVVMAARSSGQGITVRGVQDYIEGFGITAQDRTSSASMATESPRPPVATAKPEPRPVTQDREITGKDGAPMVLIPAGEFWMGSPDGEGDKGEHPRHQVSLDAFYMDKFEVTVARYAEFLRSTNRSKPMHWDQIDSSKHGNLPVAGIDWDDAEAYCRLAGKRLPTEAEWEKAARGTDERTYPWGNEQPTPRLANFGKIAYNEARSLGKESTKNPLSSRFAPMDYQKAFDKAIMGKSPNINKGFLRKGAPESFEDKSDQIEHLEEFRVLMMEGLFSGRRYTKNAYEEVLAPVESYKTGTSPYELHHMAGNVWEWTADWYDEQYYKDIPGNNPRGPSNGGVKSASWWLLAQWTGPRTVRG